MHQFKKNCPDSCGLIKFNKLRSYHLTVTKLDLRDNKKLKQAKKILNNLVPKVRQITGDKPITIKFGKIITFPKERNLKVWFVKPLMTADFKKLLLINNLLIKAFIDTKIIKAKDIVEKYNFTPVKDNKGRTFYYPIQHLTFMTLRKKSIDGKYICSRKTFDNFEKTIFPQLVSTFNKVRGELGKINLNRVDLIERGKFNHDSSPFSIVKVFFSSKKPDGATRWNKKEKIEKKAERGKAYV